MNQPINHWTKTGDELLRLATFLTVKNLRRRRSLQLITGSVHIGKVNSTQRNDPVQFSFLLCIELNLLPNPKTLV